MSFYWTMVQAGLNVSLGTFLFALFFTSLSICNQVLIVSTDPGKAWSITKFTSNCCHEGDALVNLVKCAIFLGPWLMDLL